MASVHMHSLSWAVLEYSHVVKWTVSSSKYNSLGLCPSTIVAAQLLWYAICRKLHSDPFYHAKSTFWDNPCFKIDILNGRFGWILWFLL